jgi:hypothetical protein
MNKQFYYSALAKEDTAKNYPDVTYFKIKDSIAFIFDIEKGELPKEYTDCDILYTELPWSHGYKIFNDRANNTGTNFEFFLSKIKEIIKSTDKPTVIVCGKSFIDKLPIPKKIEDINLNGYSALACIYNFDSEGMKFRNIYTLLDSLATKFECIGDFCCGYGNSGRVFAKYGKRFVLSDINPKCIGFIKNHAQEWFYENI